MSSPLKNNTVTEITIPTSYGKIAGKRWARKERIDSENGNDSDQPLGPVKILALHGWMDNAGTFDPLLHCLDLSHLDVVALDLPGHGFSSHIPPGMPYTDVFFVTEVRRVVDHLGWKSFSFIGHSMGSSAGLLFASLYPERVNCLINLDNIRMHCWPAADCPGLMAADIDKFFDIEARDKRTHGFNPAFKKDFALQALIEGHNAIGGISVAGAKALFERATRKIQNMDQDDQEEKVVFTRDPRLNAILSQKACDETIKGYIGRMAPCRVLIIFGQTGIHAAIKEKWSHFLTAYQKTCKEFRFESLAGDHYVHLSAPELLVPLIEDFLAPEILAAQMSSATIKPTPPDFW